MLPPKMITDFILFRCQLYFVLLCFVCVGCEQTVQPDSTVTGVDSFVVDQPHTENVEVVSQSGEPIIVDTESWATRLVNAGVAQETADKIVERNRILWTILAENDSEELEAQLNQIAKLGKYSAVHDTLEKQPQLAGLYAAVLHIDADAPEKLDNIFSNDRYNFCFNNYCTTHVLDTAACLNAADLYKENGDVIVQLYEAGYTMPIPETYFDTNPRETDAKKVYNTFRRNYIQNTLRHDSREEQNEKLLYLYSEGFMIINQLDADTELRDNFNDKYFPMFERVAHYHRNNFSASTILETPYIWDTFKLPDGERLVEMYGTFAATQLEQFHSKPEILQKFVIQNMLQRNEDIIYATNKFKDKPELQNLIARSIPEPDKQTIIREALKNPDRLGYYAGLSNSAILDDLHPYEGWMTYLPCYYTFNVIKKTIDGRDVTVIEIIFAVADPALIAVEIVTIPLTGGGSVIAVEAIKRGAMTATKVGVTRLAWQGTKITEKQLLKRGFKLADQNMAKQRTKIALEDAGKIIMKHASPEAGKNILKLDVSAQTSGVFNKARLFGIKNDTFKKMTGLDARIFMRSDRKVGLNLAALSKSYGFIGVPKIIVRNSIENVSMESVADTIINSEPVNDLVLKFKNKKGVIETRSLTYEEYQSAMWLSAATGKLDHAAEESVKNVAE
jgi:hypothetical protein